MKTQDLKRVEALITGMSAEEIASIQKVVSKREGQVEGAVVVQQRAASITHCPHNQIGRALFFPYLKRIIANLIWTTNAIIMPVSRCNEDSCQ